MHTKRENLTDTRIKLTVTADSSELEAIKADVVRHMGTHVKVPGFRPGKAPAHLIEKSVDPSALQTEFLEQAVNQLYVDTARDEKLRPVTQPEINITKFVPFTTLEFTAEVESVGKITLPAYTTLAPKVPVTAVSADDVNKVIDDLLVRGATKQDVTRAAKNGDEVLIDFAGRDAKTSEAIAGADGKGYPLTLGSKAFIPGFEEELIGKKAKEEVEFTITFPKDYGVKSLQSRKVTFVVNIHEVKELQKPKLDDAFAASIGPFKSVAELKTDIKKQLQAEQEREALRAYDNTYLEAIANKTKVAVPEQLIEEEIDRMEDEEKRNIAYRGQTWQEHLDEEGVTAEQHREKQREGASIRVKAGLVLAEISEAENITVSPEELEVRIQLLKGQYQDSGMQDELDKPENRRDIMSRMLTEKTLDKLRTYASK